MLSCRIPAGRVAFVVASACGGPIVCWPTKLFCNCVPTGYGLLRTARMVASLAACPETGLVKASERAIPGKVTMTMLPRRISDPSSGGRRRPWRSFYALAGSCCARRVEWQSDPSAARVRYGVAVDADGKIDAAETARIRADKVKAIGG